MHRPDLKRIHEGVMHARDKQPSNEILKDFEEVVIYALALEDEIAALKQANTRLIIMKPWQQRYPQQPGAHPERPWWQENGLLWGDPPDGGPLVAINPVWCRTDGHKVPYNADLATVDRERLMPVPEPAVGQVWLREVGDGLTEEALITGIEYAYDGCYIRCGGVYLKDSFPPEGAILIAGPGAPWGK